MRDTRPLDRRGARASPEPAKPGHPPAPPVRRSSGPLGESKLQPEIRPGESPGLDRRQASRLRRGKLPLEGRLDLHGMRQTEAHARLQAFLERSVALGRRCVLIITGKGATRAEGGVLRTEVPRWLNEPQNRGKVLTFTYAQPRDGGDGALYVLLKRRALRGRERG